MPDVDRKKPRSDRRRRTQTIIFRVTPADFALLAEEAANTNMANTNAWVRAVAFEAVGRPELSRKDLQCLIGEIGRIGTNINQIAKVANISGRVDLVTDLYKTRTELVALKKLIVRELS
ncbi:mobilisation protein (MobC) [Loktanella salsilacus]|jgi:hypothetical protein|uniref:Mobilisation protein (MobC) n=1 Tax=Loktanella salsilacus TaxID=195913 RepID=A0A1I4IY55_9RHOB|nr:plasmid mobilization relaxosome protein MobC [Loktanella salsilacus]SFL58781.1 mobilisation protein (MobC) [Loktanella salsilacus]